MTIMALLVTVAIVCLVLAESKDTFLHDFVESSYILTSDVYHFDSLHQLLLVGKSQELGLTTNVL